MRGKKVHGRAVAALLLCVFLYTSLFFIAYRIPHGFSSVHGKLSPHQKSSSSAKCPEYFRWIHEDLWDWRETGITREMVMRGSRTATFRLVIVNGSAYIQAYGKAYESRDIFTVWGILQLLRKYPGKLPDLELMFDCEDEPAIQMQDFIGPNATLPPPPLFAYCSTDSNLDIPFPDWSFWGWPELQIRPWEGLSKELQEANKRIKWVDREPFAYWKGNPSTSLTRFRMVYKCNVTEYQDWGARLYLQNWTRTMEEQQGFKESKLVNQCTHRYKIYVEGRTWSASEKYIMACNSPTLLVKPHYNDFFTRSLMPLKHYWPLRDDDKCRPIKHAVDWGNSHPQQAQKIGEAGSKFTEEELKMDHIYDYMFHLLSEYAKLMKYKPSVSTDEGLQLITSEYMISIAQGLEKQYMMESMVKAPSQTPPCTMPPRFESDAIKSFLQTKQNLIKKVVDWEKKYWETNGR